MVESRIENWQVVLDVSVNFAQSGFSIVCLLFGTSVRCLSCRTASMYFQPRWALLCCSNSKFVVYEAVAKWQSLTCLVLLFSSTFFVRLIYLCMQNVSVCLSVSVVVCVFERLSAWTDIHLLVHEAIGLCGSLLFKLFINWRHVLQKHAHGSISRVGSFFLVSRRKMPESCVHAITKLTTDRDHWLAKHTVSTLLSVYLCFFHHQLFGVTCVFKPPSPSSPPLWLSINPNES